MRNDNDPVTRRNKKDGAPSSQANVVPGNSLASHLARREERWREKTLLAQHGRKLVNAAAASAFAVSDHQQESRSVQGESFAPSPRAPQQNNAVAARFQPNSGEMDVIVNPASMSTNTPAGSGYQELIQSKILQSGPVPLSLHLGRTRMAASGSNVNESIDNCSSISSLFSKSQLGNHSLHSSQNDRQEEHVAQSNILRNDPVLEFSNRRSVHDRPKVENEESTRSLFHDSGSLHNRHPHFYHGEERIEQQANPKHEENEESVRSAMSLLDNSENSSYNHRLEAELIQSKIIQSGQVPEALRRCDTRDVTTREEQSPIKKEESLSSVRSHLQRNMNSQIFLYDELIQSKDMQSGHVPDSLRRDHLRVDTRMENQNEDVNNDQSAQSLNTSISGSVASRQMLPRECDQLVASTKELVFAPDQTGNLSADNTTFLHDDLVLSKILQDGTLTDQVANRTPYVDLHQLPISTMRIETTSANALSCRRSNKIESKPDEGKKLASAKIDGEISQTAVTAATNDSLRDENSTARTSAAGFIITRKTEERERGINDTAEQFLACSAPHHLLREDDDYENHPPLEEMKRSDRSNDCNTLIIRQEYTQRRQRVQNVEINAARDVVGPYVGTITADDDLVVAVAIDEDVDVRPVAVAHEVKLGDLNSGNASRRRKLQQQRVRRLVLMISLLTCVLAIAAMTLRSFRKKESTQQAASFPPINDVQTAIETVIGSELLQESQSPYAKALQWILHDDAFQLTANSNTLFQRYFAACFYYATTTTGQWDSCNPEADSVHCLFLAGTVPQQAFRWLSNTSECSWAGILCDYQGRITSLTMSTYSCFETFHYPILDSNLIEFSHLPIPDHNNLTGSFPKGLYYFPFLQRCELAQGGLVDTLPVDLPENMKNLNYLSLRANQLYGKVPTQWWQMSKLIYIDLGMNRLEGIISQDVGDLMDLKYFHLNSNNFDGSLPNQIGNLNSVSDVDVSDNFLQGSIPVTISGLLLVEKLWICNNSITGSIPSTVGQLSTIDDLRLRGNQLAGTIPEQIFRLSSLALLDLSQNNLSGSLSSSISDFSPTLFSALFINQNNFSGTIPSSIGNLAFLDRMELQGNNFYGTFPANICLMPWSVLIADCSKLAGSRQCCTKCCSNDGTNCLPTH